MSQSQFAESNPVSLQQKHLNFPDRLPYDPSSLPGIDSIYNAGVEAGDFEKARQDPHHRDLSEKAVKKTMTDVLDEITKLEILAREPSRRQVSPEVVKKVKRVIRFSAPGTYYYPAKPDKYVSYRWAENMDRLADDDVACLVINLAGVLTGKDFSAFRDVVLLDDTNPTLNSLRGEVRQAIVDSGIRMVYLGRPDEAAAIQRVINRKGSFIPPSSVDLISISDPDGNDDNINTVSQVLALKQYYKENPAKFPDEIDVLCDFAPRLVREKRSIDQYCAVPDGITLAVLPLATPASGKQILRELEARGAVAYAMRGDATIEPPVYKSIHDLII